MGLFLRHVKGGFDSSATTTKNAACCTVMCSVPRFFLEPASLLGSVNAGLIVSGIWAGANFAIAF